MKKLLLIFIMMIGFAGTAQTKVIHQKLKLKNVPAGEASDSILVMQSNGRVNQMPRSSFVPTPVTPIMEAVAAPGDPYYGPRVAPVDAASQGYLISTSDNNAMGYMAETTSTGNAAYAGFIARGAGGPFENAFAMEFFSPNYFVPFLQNRGAIYAATDSYWVTGRSTDEIAFKISASAAHSATDTRSKLTINNNGVTLHDGTDDTKKATFDLIGVGTGQDRQLSIQDSDGTLAYLSDITAAAQNLQAVTDEGNLTNNDIFVQNGANYSYIRAGSGFISTGNGTATSTLQPNYLGLKNTGNFTAGLDASLLTSNRTFQYPDNAGTLALLSDITSNQNGLKYVDEGNGLGWRLAARDDTHHGNIGNNAIDLSTYFGTSTTHGATGYQSVAIGDGIISSATNSFAIGAVATASGGNSMTFGVQSNATNNHAMAIGHTSNATGSYSFTFGRGNTANNTNSVAMGISNTASGNGSVAIGNNSQASGQNSSTLGFEVNSYSFGEVNVGTYSTFYTPVGTTYVDLADRAFNVGIGFAGGSSRLDGFTVMKNGEVLAPDLTTLEIDNAADNVLVTKEWVNANGTVDVTVVINTTDISNLTEYELVPAQGVGTYITPIRLVVRSNVTTPYLDDNFANLVHNGNIMNGNMKVYENTSGISDTVNGAGAFGGIAKNFADVSNQPLDFRFTSSSLGGVGTFTLHLTYKVVDFN